MLSTCLSLPSVFVHKQDQSHPLMPQFLKFHSGRGTRPKLFPILLHRYTKRFGTRAFERCLVSITLTEIKLIYCTSIKQRERNYFRQLIVRCLRFKCKPTTHYMLTNHFYPLSKPVSPSGSFPGFSIRDGKDNIFSIEKDLFFQKNRHISL